MALLRYIKQTFWYTARVSVLKGFSSQLTQSCQSVILKASKGCGCPGSGVHATQVRIALEDSLLMFHKPHTSLSKIKKQLEQCSIIVSENLAFCLPPSMLPWGKGGGDGNNLCSWPSLDRVRWKRAAKSPEVLNVKTGETARSSAVRFGGTAAFISIEDS